MEILVGRLVLEGKKDPLKQRLKNLLSRKSQDCQGVPGVPQKSVEARGPSTLNQPVEACSGRFSSAQAKDCIRAPGPQHSSVLPEGAKKEKSSGNARSALAHAAPKPSECNMVALAEGRQFLDGSQWSESTRDSPDSDWDIMSTGNAITRSLQDISNEPLPASKPSPCLWNSDARPDKRVETTVAAHDACETLASAASNASVGVVPPSRSLRDRVRLIQERVEALTDDELKSPEGLQRLSSSLLQSCSQSLASDPQLLQEQQQQQQQQQHLPQFSGEHTQLPSSCHSTCAEGRSPVLESSRTGENRSSAHVGLLGCSCEATTGTNDSASAFVTHESPSRGVTPIKCPSMDPQRNHQGEAGKGTSRAETEQDVVRVDVPASEVGKHPADNQQLRQPANQEGCIRDPEPPNSQARFNIAVALHNFAAESMEAQVPNMGEPKHAGNAAKDGHSMQFRSATGATTHGFPVQEPGLRTQSKSQAVAKKINSSLKPLAALQYTRTNGPERLLSSQLSSGGQGAPRQVPGALPHAHAENSAMKHTESGGLPSADWVPEQHAPPPQGQRVQSSTTCAPDEHARIKALSLNGVGDLSSPGSMQTLGRHITQSCYGWDVQSSGSNAWGPGHSLAEMPSSLSTPTGSGKQLPLLTPEGLANGGKLCPPLALEQAVAQHAAHTHSEKCARPVLGGGQSSSFPLNFSVHASQQQQQQEGQVGQGPPAPLSTTSSTAASSPPLQRSSVLDHLYMQQQQQQQRFSAPGTGLHHFGDASLAGVCANEATFTRPSMARGSLAFAAGLREPQMALKHMLEGPRLLDRASGTSSWLHSDACTNERNTAPMFSRVATASSLSSCPSWADEVAVAVGGLQRALAMASTAGLSMEERAALQAVMVKLALLQQHQHNKQNDSNNRQNCPLSLQLDEALLGARDSSACTAIPPSNAATTIPASGVEKGWTWQPPIPSTAARQHIQPNGLPPLQAHPSNHTSTPSGQECMFPASNGWKCSHVPGSAAHGRLGLSCEAAHEKGPVARGQVVHESSASTGQMDSWEPVKAGPQSRTTEVAGSMNGVGQGLGAVLGQQGHADQQHQQQRQVQHKPNTKDRRRTGCDSSAVEGPVEGLRMRFSASHAPTRSGGTGAAGAALGIRASSSLEEPANSENMLLWRGDSSGSLPVSFAAPSSKSVQALLLVAGCVVAVFNVLMILLVVLSS